VLRPPALPGYPFQKDDNPIAPWLSSQGFGPGQTWRFDLPAGFTPSKLRVGEIFDTPLCSVALRTKVFKADPVYVTYYEGHVAYDSHDGHHKRGTEVRLLIALYDNIGSDERALTYIGFIQLGPITHPTIAQVP